MILLEGVTKKFGNKVAVDNLSLKVKEGEFFTILGPNGAGKTTTIKMIVGLLRPTNGRIFVRGIDVQKDPLAIKKIVAYVPEEPYLYEKLTGREFLRFVADLHDIPKKKADDTIENLVFKLEMDEFIDALTETYSHGMKQRVVIATVLLRAPEILLVDEPLVGLDPRISKTVKSSFKELTKNGSCILMSTHLLYLAEELSDRVGIINNGRLIGMGTMGELKKQTGVDGNLEQVFFKLTEEQAL
jgi:ABC-2 type transport system ATP-binding protein